MKFRGTGRQIDLQPVDSAPPKTRVVYPSIAFSSKELPEILDWRVGDEYEVVLKIKQKDIYSSSDNKPARANFDVTGVAVKHTGMGDKGKKLVKMLKKRRY